jgi:hypothetical protein
VTRSPHLTGCLTERDRGLLEHVASVTDSERGVGQLLDDEHREPSSRANASKTGIDQAAPSLHARCAIDGVKD